MILFIVIYNLVNDAFEGRILFCNTELIGMQDIQ